MSEEDWDVSEWECFEKNVAAVSSNAEALKQKLDLEAEAFNMVNDLFDNSTSQNENKKQEISKNTTTKPVKSERPGTGRPRPNSGRKVKLIQPQRQIHKKKNTDKMLDDEDVNEDLDYCCDITDRILSRCN